MRKTKYLIIGAGISGLTFANYAKGDYLIVEKDSEVGGYCKTFKQNGFVWDFAGHFFHFATEEFRKKFLKSENADNIVEQDKCTKIFYDGRSVDYPFQTNIHQLEKQEFIDCLYDLFNKEEKEEYDNFLDMLYGKFGKSITEKFLKPYNEKLYAVDLKTLDKDAMGRFFPYANKEQIINNMKSENFKSYNSNFLYPRDGAASFINILYDKIDKTKILLNTEITCIDFKNHVATTNIGEKIEYEYLINSSPLNRFLNFFDDEKTNKLRESLSYNKVLVFNLGFNKKSKFKDEHWFYVPDKDCNYYRIGFYDNILDDDRLSMYIEIGYSKESVITKEEIDRQLKLTLDNLLKHEVIDEQTKLEDFVSVIMDPAYVHISTKTDKIVKEFMKDIAIKNTYSIGRYGAWTYCSMEDCMVAAKELADQLN